VERKCLVALLLTLKIVARRCGTKEYLMTKPEADGSARAVADARWMHVGIAFVWLATGLAVLHPEYRRIGMGYLDRLGLPALVMYATCAGEVVLGLCVVFGRSATWLTLLQAALIVGFSVILALLDPWLLVDRFGMLTKNLPLLALIGTAWLVEREGWTTRAAWLLRGGMAIIWITEGLFPKIFFVVDAERQTVTASGVPFGDRPDVFLFFLGMAQALSGALALLLRGWLLRIVLVCQMAALIVLPLLVSRLQPELWWHPFGPFTKTVPILVGTWMVLWRCTPLPRTPSGAGSAAG
jgi:hypothetical protein